MSKFKYTKDQMVSVKESGLVGQVTQVSADQSVVAVRLNNGGSAEFLNGEIQPYNEGGYHVNR